MAGLAFVDDVGVGVYRRDHFGDAVDCVVFPRLLSQDGTFFRPWWLSGWQWLGNVSLTEIWRHHVAGGNKALYLGHAWTLCYEEQFYVVVGLLLLVAPRRFFAGAVAVTALTLAACLASRWTGATWPR